MPDILNAQAAGGAQNGELGGGEFITDTDTAGFEADVIKASASQPVIVDFWAEWCGPCKTLGPILEKIVNEYGGAVRLGLLAFLGLTVKRVHGASHLADARGTTGALSLGRSLSEPAPRWRVK